MAVGGAGSFSTLRYHGPEVWLARRSKMMPVTATRTKGGNKEQAGQIRAAQCAQVRGESGWGWACLLVDMAPASTRFAAFGIWADLHSNSPLAMMETGHWTSLRSEMQAVLRAEASAIEEHYQWPLVPGRREVA